MAIKYVFNPLSGQFDEVSEVTLAAVGSTPNANSATLTGQILNLEAANGSFPGILSTTTQDIPGAKTFLEPIVIESGVSYAHTRYEPSGALSGSNVAWETGYRTGQPYYSLVMDDGSTKTTVFDAALNGIIGFTSIVSANAVRANTISDSAGGSVMALDVTGQGLHVETGANDITLQVKGNAAQSGDIFQVVNSSDAFLAGISNAGALTLTSTITASNFSGTSSGTNTGDVTLAAVGATPNANGATLTGQILNLQAADGSFPGALTASAQTIGGNKYLAGITSIGGTLATIEPLLSSDVIGLGSYLVNSSTASVQAAGIWNWAVQTKIDSGAQASNQTRGALKAALNIAPASLTTYAGNYRGMQFNATNTLGNITGTMTAATLSATTLVGATSTNQVGLLVSSTNSSGIIQTNTGVDLASVHSTGTDTVAHAAVGLRIANSAITAGGSSISNTATGIEIRNNITATDTVPLAYAINSLSTALSQWAGPHSLPAGTVGAPSLYLSTDTTTGLYRPSANNLNVGVSGAVVANFASTGLAVTGAISATTTLSGTGANFSGLTASQAVVTDGSKNLASLSYVSTATASTLMSRDANANTRVNNLIENFATTATAAGTTTLTVSSSRTQQFTGTTTQTVVLPDATTLVVGQAFTIINRSTGIVTVNANGGGLIQTMVGGSQTIVTVTSIGSSAGTWDSQYSIAGIVAAVNPTVQKFTTGSGTYTTPAGVQYIRVRMVGGGGGGAGSGGPSQGSGGAGGNTTFGTTLLVANGGTGGTGSNGVPGTGGTASLGTGPIGTTVTGAFGTGAAPANSLATIAPAGGPGGATAFGGGGGGGAPGGTGGAASANSGGGGGGAGLGFSTASGQAGAGGGAGGFVDAVITGPAATYAYAIGAAGTAGTAGTSGSAGGVGGAGYIEVTEYYTNLSVGTTAAVTANQVFAGPGSGAAATPAFRALVGADIPVVVPGTSAGAVSASGVTGSTTGSSIAAGFVGEFLSASANVTVSSGSITAVTSLTLTAGVWLVSGTYNNDNNATQTGFDSYFYQKGTNVGTQGVDKILARYAAAQSHSATFAPRVLVIATADATKTIEIRAQAITANQTGYGYLTATRIA